VGLGQMLKTQRALEPFVQFADSSESALKSAERNAQEVGLKCEVSRFDLVENEWPWKELFDIVVCDPPALIKSKKHYFAGRRAYLKAVLRSLNSLQKDGLLVLSSCSFHLAREDLKEIIMEASQIIKTPVRILHDFSAPVDHLRGPEFPEGDYLKGLLCIKDA
jgi:23S rRNA (cytosine1962-C5)-methyltransferase